MEKQKSEFAQDNFSEMYSKLPNLILAFHGCSKETFEQVIAKGQGLAKSENKYICFVRKTIFCRLIPCAKYFLKETAFIRNLAFMKKRIFKSVSRIRIA